MQFVPRLPVFRPPPPPPRKTDAMNGCVSQEHETHGWGKKKMYCAVDNPPLNDDNTRVVVQGKKASLAWGVLGVLVCKFRIISSNE